MPNKEKYNPDNEHSQEKLRIYSEYLTVYLNVLLNIFDSVNIYDMMAGEAFYKSKNGRMLKGSAVLAFEAIKECMDKKKTHENYAKKVCLYLNDINPKKHESLQDYKTTQNVDWMDCQNKDVNKAISWSLAQTRADKNFFYLDPCGYTQIRKTSIDAIVHQEENECLWFVPVTHIVRFVKKELAEELVPPVDKFLRDYEIDVSKHTNAKWQDWAKILKDAFKRSYPESCVGMAKLEKTKGPNYYALYFIGNNILGLQKFIDVVNDSDNLQMELFPPSDSEIISYLSESQTKFRTNCDLYKHMLMEGWSRSSALNLLKTMEEDGKIKVFPEPGVKRNKGAFYLSHKVGVKIRVQEINTLF